jgi:hypothetical protein
MKATRWEDVLSGSEGVGRKSSARRSSDESLFSRLLKVESRLRAGFKVDPDFGFDRRRSLTLKSLQRSAPSTISRYVE